MNIAKRNGVVWTPVDSDEPNYVGVTGVHVDILGQANVWTVFDNFEAIIYKYWWQDFHLPQDPEMRSDSCKRVQENREKMNEYIEDLEKKVKNDKCRKVQPNPYQVKEFTLNSEIRTQTGIHPGKTGITKECPEVSQSK